MHALYIFGVAASAFTALLLATPVPAAEVKVMNSGGFTAAYKELAPGCERATGHKVETAWAPRWERRRTLSRCGSRVASPLTC